MPIIGGSQWVSRDAPPLHFRAVFGEHLTNDDQKRRLGISLMDFRIPLKILY